MPATDRNAEIREKLDAIEAEMRRLGIWEIPAPAPEACGNMGAFGMNTMAYEQWLRHVFVPRVRQTLETGGPWPPSSSVGTQAIRNFDGWHEGSDLIDLLCQFDDLFQG